MQGNIKERIIPVLEIKKGTVVESAADGKHIEEHGQFPGSSPKYAALFYKQLGFREIYVSDLDGILEEKPDLDLLEELSLIDGLSLMADIGTWSYDELMRLDGLKPVISTETFSSINLVNLPENFVLAIETKCCDLLCEMDVDLAGFTNLIKDSPNVKEVLVIDLLAAEKLEGPNLDLCRFMARAMPEKRIVYGGGVRGLADAARLLESGADRVLAGAALWKGGIIEDLSKE